MNCSMYEELLAPYCENELDSDTRQDVEAHIAQCHHCRTFLSRLQSLEVFIDSCAEGINEISERSLAEPSSETNTSTEHRFQAIQRRLNDSVSASDSKDAILTPQQVAEYLKIPVATVHEMSWELPFFRIGQHLRIRKTRLIEWIEEQEHRTGREALTTAAGQL